MVSEKISGSDNMSWFILVVTGIRSEDFPKFCVIISYFYIHVIMIVALHFSRRTNTKIFYFIFIIIPIFIRSFFC